MSIQRLLCDVFSKIDEGGYTSYGLHGHDILKENVTDEVMNAHQHMIAVAGLIYDMEEEIEDVEKRIDILNKQDIVQAIKILREAYKTIVQEKNYDSKAFESEGSQVEEFVSDMLMFLDDLESCIPGFDRITIPVFQKPWLAGEDVNIDQIFRFSAKDIGMPYTQGFGSDGLRVEFDDNDGHVKKMAVFSQGVQISPLIEIDFCKETGVQHARYIEEFVTTKDSCNEDVAEYCTWIHEQIYKLTDVIRKRMNALDCTFCKASQRDVKKLVAGPTGIYICNACVELCHDIVMDTFDDEN